MRGYVFRESGGDPVALTAKSCRIVYDLWDEVFRIQITQPGGQIDTIAVNVEGVLRQCAEARKLRLIERALARRRHAILRRRARRGEPARPRGARSHQAVGDAAERIDRDRPGRLALRIVRRALRRADRRRRSQGRVSNAGVLPAARAAAVREAREEAVDRWIRRRALRARPRARPDRASPPRPRPRDATRPRTRSGASTSCAPRAA